MHTEKNTSYDYIIAGMGAAGLSLAMQLKRSTVPFTKILLIDKALKNTNDRTWCFWTTETDAWYSPVVYRRWDRVAFKSVFFEKDFDLKPYSYLLIRGIDFYSYCLDALRRDPRFEIVTAEIQSIRSEADVAVLQTKEAVYEAAVIFNSAFRHNRIQKQHINYVQHFKGWIIETPVAAFDADCPVFMDFRTEQHHDCRFFYVIPFSATRALIEYTGFSPAVLQDCVYDENLKSYIEERLAIKQYTVLETEYGEIPMMESDFVNPYGSRVVNIGTAGGNSKTSTGYTFYFIQKSIRTIVRRLEKKERIHDTKKTWKFKLYDAVLLDVMDKNRIPSDALFTALFKNNKISRLLSFLNEESSLWNDLSIMRSVPLKAFLLSTFYKIMGR